VFALASLANIRQDCVCFPGENALAFLVAAFENEEKRFDDVATW